MLKQLTQRKDAQKTAKKAIIVSMDAATVAKFKDKTVFEIGVALGADKIAFDSWTNKAGTEIPTLNITDAKGVVYSFNVSASVIATRDADELTDDYLLDCMCRTYEYNVKTIVDGEEVVKTLPGCNIGAPAGNRVFNGEDVKSEPTMGGTPVMNEVVEDKKVEPKLATAGK